MCGTLKTIALCERLFKIYMYKHVSQFAKTRTIIYSILTGIYSTYLTSIFVSN